METTATNGTADRRRNMTHWLAALLPLAVCIVILAYLFATVQSITGGIIGAPLDDTWIHFQFARNISQGQGFSYNPGEPTPGSTAPLWTILLAGFYGLTNNLMPVALALSALFLLATVLITFGFTNWVTHSAWAAVLAAVGVALAGRMQWAGLAGMETTAFAALSVVGIWAFSRRGLGWLPALLFGLASQLRPEGHALFALALADAAWAFWRKSGRRDWRSAARTFLPALGMYAVLSLPYVAFSLSTTGQPLPNTFYAKVGAEQLFSWRTLRETLVLHWQDNPVSFILMFAGLWPLWQRSRLAVLWLVGMPLLTAVVIDTTWHHGRYTMPLIPCKWWLRQPASTGCRPKPRGAGTRVLPQPLPRLPWDYSSLLVARGDCLTGPRCWGRTRKRLRTLTSRSATGWPSTPNQMT